MRRLGATCVACMFAVVGSLALGGAGYMTMTGKSLCSMVSSCGEKSAEAAKTEKNVTNVANKEAGDKKSCCPLSGAKAEQIAAKEGGCAKTCSEAKTTTIAAKEGGCAKTCSEAKTTTVAAKEGGCAKTCSEAKTTTVAAKEGGCTGEAKAEKVAAASGCCKSKAKAMAFGRTVNVGSGMPVMIPAVFAKAMPAKADAGCCKGSGARADGQPCKKDGEHCNKDEAKTEKAGEPIASR